jgi:D-galactose 1-dehydrogenase
MPIRLAIVGVGKIVRDQHAPALNANPDYALVAAASPHSVLDGVDMFKTLDEMLAAKPEIDAVAVCTPPQVRHDIALAAIKAGKHVLLEKPPGATVSEVDSLKTAIGATGKTLYATWHSRHAPAVAQARDWVQGKALSKVEIVWREDVRRWHPGQPWIWAAGGLGVFDPGVNALSIATLILPAFFLTSAELSFPANKDAPIAAKLAFNIGGPQMTADFDWRQTGEQTWDIRIETKDGATLHLEQGGAALTIDGKAVDVGPEREYPSIYESFAGLIKTAQSEVDVRPLEQAADAFLLGKRVVVEAFED